VKAVVVLSSPVFDVNSSRVAALTIRSRLPAISAFREFADAGGLMAYGPDLKEFFRRSALYVAKIIEGAKPGDLPIEQPTKFQLVINLKTAKALGLTIPPSLLLRADEVIR
jgi:putative ABC transport system substrate-binding protein